MLRRKLSCAVLVACVVGSVGAAAEAEPVVYTLTGQFTGSLGATSFTDTTGTFTFVGDTSTTDDIQNAFYTNTTGVSTITLDGLGTAVFLSDTFGVEGETGGAGFADFANGSNFSVGIEDPNLGLYDLSAPFTDTAYFVNGPFIPETGPELTSLGELNIDSGDYNNPTTTFQASVVVPEPAMVCLLGLAAATTLARRRRR